ncbi:MAG: immunoglobulin-like domain-containing protein [Bulleidia sp.]|nr:immunoglobulin-like domain-containing protein [Bulleidia sp.]
MNHKGIIFCVCGIAAAGLLLHFGCRIVPDTDSVDFLYGEKVFVPEYQAHLFGIDVHDQVQVIEDIDEKKYGSYTINYNWKFLGIPFGKAKTSVNILDVDAPEIQLTGDAVCFTKINETYTLPAYSVKDNCDPETDIEVKITGNVDNTKAGTYDAMLTACDLSGNCSGKALTMVVSDVSDVEFEQPDFNLEKYDSGNIILPYAEELLDDYKFSEILFCGDSNYVNMSVYNGLPGSQVIGRYALAPDTFEEPSFYQGIQTDVSVSEYIRRLQSKILLLNMGLAEIGNGNPLKMIDTYEKCIDEIHELSPDTQVVIAAVLPVCESYNEPGLEQSQINRYNYCLLEMCSRLGLKMVDPNIYFKDGSGWANPDFFLEDGYHIKAAFFNLYEEVVRRSIMSMGD